MFLDPRFWLAISFFIFLALMIKYIMPKIINALENLRPMKGPENISKADNYDEKEFKLKGENKPRKLIVSHFENENSRRLSELNNQRKNN